MTSQNEEVKAKLRRPEAKGQPRSKAKRSRGPRPILRYRSSQISTAARKHDQNINFGENVGGQRPRVSHRLGLCNTILGAIGLVSALSFGIVTIVQADTANKEVKIANKISKKSLMLSWVQTCAQVMDISNSTMCALVEEFVGEIFWPKEDPVWWGDSVLACRMCKTSFYLRSDNTFTEDLLQSLRTICEIADNLDYKIWALFSSCSNPPEAIHTSFNSLDLREEMHQSSSLRIIHRLFNLYFLVILLYFLAMGFVMRILDGWDLASAMAKRRRQGRTRLWDVQIELISTLRLPKTPKPTILEAFAEAPTAIADPDALLQQHPQELGPIARITEESGPRALPESICV
ncbi:hypothetical protein F5882DRAFT_381184 [Hyaloscypha sp. PMI_1271]|nr:hypothetical protein F5882DRAFT_381184 [Hyaloscypha sp. PMI_1271]